MWSLIYAGKQNDQPARITTFLAQARRYKIYQPQYAVTEGWVLHCWCKSERMNTTCNWCDRLCCVSTELECSYAFKTQLFHINKRQNSEIDTSLTVCIIFIVPGTWILLSLAKLYSRSFKFYINTKERLQKKKKSWRCISLKWHGMDMQYKNQRNLRRLGQALNL